MSAPVSIDRGMSLQEVTDYAKEFLRKEYNLELDIPVYINNRLKSTQGQVLSIKGVPTSVDFRGDLLRYGDKEAICRVIRHEMIHVAFIKLGKHSSDGQQEFEQELNKKQALSSYKYVIVYPNGEKAYRNEYPPQGKTRYTVHKNPSYYGYLIGVFTQLQCSKCKKISYCLNKKVLKKPDEYETKCCKAEIVPLGSVIFDGNSDEPITDYKEKGGE